jgi:RecA/RadA recombinase
MLVSESIPFELVGLFVLWPEDYAKYRSTFEPAWLPTSLQPAIFYMDDCEDLGETWDIGVMANTLQVSRTDIMRWTEIAPSPYVHAYVKRIEILRDSFFSQRMTLMTEPLEADELLAEWNDYKPKKAIELEDPFALALERIDTRVANVAPELPMPSKRLNDATGGFIKGKFHVIAGATSHAKTTFAVNCVLEALRNRKKVLYLDYEMSEADIVFALTACNKTHPIGDLRLSRDKELSVKSKRAVMETKERFKDLIQIRVGAKWQEIVDAIDTFNPDMVVIDHIQIFGQVMPEKKGASSAYHLSDLARKLSRLALEKNVAMVVLSQVNRNAKGRMPNLSELKESGGIEENANLALMCYYGYRDTMDETKKTELLIQTAKNRNGGNEIFGLHFNVECGKITGKAHDYSEVPEPFTDRYPIN